MLIRRHAVDVGYWWNVDARGWCEMLMWWICGITLQHSANVRENMDERYWHEMLMWFLKYDVAVMLMWCWCKMSLWWKYGWKKVDMTSLWVQVTNLHPYLENRQLWRKEPAQCFSAPYLGSRQLWRKEPAQCFSALSHGAYNVDLCGGWQIFLSNSKQKERP